MTGGCTNIIRCNQICKYHTYEKATREIETPLHWKDSFWQDELLQLDVQWIPEEESLLVKLLQHDGMMIDDDWMTWITWRFDE